MALTTIRLFKQAPLRAHITSNPARLALPNAPKAYQTESVKAWTDGQLQAIVEVVREGRGGRDRRVA